MTTVRSVPTERQWPRLWFVISPTTCQQPLLSRNLKLHNVPEEEYFYPDWGLCKKTRLRNCGFLPAVELATCPVQTNWPRVTGEFCDPCAQEFGSKKNAVCFLLEELERLEFGRRGLWGSRNVGEKRVPPTPHTPSSWCSENVYFPWAGWSLPSQVECQGGDT